MLPRKFVVLLCSRHNVRWAYLFDNCDCWACFRKLRAIMRHVIFSMRSWLGKFCFAFAKKRQTCVASGSSFASSSGLELMPASPSLKPCSASTSDKRRCATLIVSERSKRSCFTVLRPVLSLAPLLLFLLREMMLLLLLLLFLLWLSGDAVAVRWLLLTVLASDCSNLMVSAPLSASLSQLGLRGKRQSWAVIVGSEEARGLDMDTAAMTGK